MKVLLLALGSAPARSHFESIHCENYLGSAEEGHEIITFGYNEGVDIKINPEDDFQKVIDKLPEGWKPDCCILWEVDWNLLPKGIDEAPCPVVVVPWDWDYDLPLSRAIVMSADITIALADYEKEALEKIGGNVELYYPIGIMEKYIDPSPKKMEDRTYDIFYTSTIDREGRSDRAKWILKLCSLSGKYNVYFRENLPSFTEYVSTLRDSRLVLSHHRYGSMSGRILEAGAQGTVVLESGTEVTKHFEENREYIPVNEKNFLKQVEKYLNDKDGLQDISNRVHEKVARNYEAKKQFMGLLRFIGEKIKGPHAEHGARKSKDMTDARRHLMRGEIYFYSYFRSTGYFLMNTGSKLLELSIQEFQKAVELERSPGALTGLAVAMTSFGFRYDEREITATGGKAIAAVLDEAISIDPKYVMAWYNLGMLHYRTADFSKAMDYFDMTLKLFDDPESTFDPWCLQSRDYDLFNQLMRKPLNSALLLACRGEEGRANGDIKNMFKSLVYCLISIIKESRGRIHEALEALRESHRLYPDFDIVAVRAARLSALLGYGDESLRMYEKVIELLPFNIAFRVEYFEMLYICGMDKKLFNSINDALKITGTVTQMKEFTHVIARAVKGFGRSNNEVSYSYDSGREKILSRFAVTIFKALQKDPDNLLLVLRLADLWTRMGLIGNIFKLAEEYIKRNSGNGNIDEEALSVLSGISGNLRKQCSGRKSENAEKLKKIESILYQERSDRLQTKGGMYADI